ncbi:MAG: protein translocase subunit SecD [Vicinamibacterales bacterium]
MDKNLRWRLIVILAVVAISIWGFYPPSEKVKLGLDLKGGVHLVLRVQADDALRLDTETVMEQLMEGVEAKGLVNVAFAPVDPTRFKVDGVPQDQDAAFREAANEIETRFNRESGTGGSYSFVMKPNMVVQLREDAVEQAVQTIERRVNELGVAEPIVARTGAAGDEILVQLPGVADPQRAKDIIRSTALLELKLVEDGPASTKEQLLQARGGVLPGNMEVVPGVSDTGAPGDRVETVFYMVRKVAVVTGRDLRNAKPSLDEMNRPAVSFSLNTDGARKFGKATGENIGRRLAIILDGRVQSAPVIEGRIFDEGRISGTFTQREVQDLSLILRSGALPASLTYLEERTIGPSLGAESIRSGVTAALGGLALVVLFLLFFYRLSGLNALVAMVINLVVLLAMMSYFGAAMTLPGIAGFILTIGMGVDSNVLIFERIKEELAAQKGVKQAIAAGFDRVLLTILDTHVASLISAAFLFQFGTSPIRGFATTLSIGLLSNVFTSVFVSRTLFELVLSRRRTATLSI